jgi:hypothetical protein
MLDPHYCRLCMGEEVPTGTPAREPERLELSEFAGD